MLRSFGRKLPSEHKSIFIQLAEKKAQERAKIAFEKLKSVERNRETKDWNPDVQTEPFFDPNLNKRKSLRLNTNNVNQQQHASNNVNQQQHVSNNVNQQQHVSNNEKITPIQKTKNISQTRKVSSVTLLCC
jgi:hypothetical protein